MCFPARFNPSDFSGLRGFSLASLFDIGLCTFCLSFGFVSLKGVLYLDRAPADLYCFGTGNSVNFPHPNYYQSLNWIRNCLICIDSQCFAMCQS